MAITFSKDLSTTTYLSMYNNNIVEFKSDEAVLEHVKCTITLGGVSLVITPDPTDKFRFNFKEIVSSLFANDFIQNTIATDGRVEDILNNAVYQTSVSYVITFSDSSTETINKTYLWIKAVDQIESYIERKTTDAHILSPLNLTVFKGFPFDIGVLNNAEEFRVANSTTQEQYYSNDGESFTQIIFNSGLFPNGEYSNRCQTQGATIESDCFEYGNLLQTGWNDLRFYIDQENSLSMKIEMKDVCDGVYLKWFNRFGWWSYWLFERVYVESTGARIVDTYNNDFNDVPDTISPFMITKKETTRKRTIKQTIVNQSQMEQLKDILKSPHVMKYNGDNSWETVILSGGNFITKNTKNGLVNLEFDIEINQYNI